MRIWTVALLLCGVGAASATPQPRAAPARPTRPARSLPGAGAGAGDHWQNIIADYTRGVQSAGGAGSAWSGGSWSPIPIQVPLQGDNSGRTSVSLLVVPVPVPVAAPPAGPAQCTSPASQIVTPTPAAPSHSNPFGFVSSNNLPPLQPYPVFNNELSQSSVDPAPTATLALPAPSAPSGLISRIDARLARNAPNFPPVADSRILVEQFRAQVPDDPLLPPVVIAPVEVVSTDDHTVDELREAESYGPTTQLHHNFLSGGAAGEAPLERRHVKCKKRRVEGARGNSAEPDQEEQAREPPPPPPRFERSLYLEARLTVPRADYTEPYKVWWDAASGASRVFLHGGTTSIYRMVKTGGLVQSAQIRVDRTAETDVRHCIVSGTRRVSLAERALPALPDLRAFSFAGYVMHDTKRAELWRHTLSGHNGELGGVRGEALTFRHELLVTRSADNYTTTPHWYSVRVDSSVLGADADGYVHYFDKVLEQPHDAAMFHLDIADACETLETTNRMESIEPLREFTSLRRLPRYDGEFAQYKQLFGRTYADDVEEAVRKTLLMQTSRFVASGNRQGATFALDVNFLADRLAVERRELLGAQAAPDDDPGVPFPLPPAEVEAQRGRLPRSFDWRQRGGVTPVRFQGANCMSCWAFATVGAVEGALFRETGRLVPLSEQALVDCARPYGGHGCKPGTWPSAAYNYIKDKGLPALDEYPYKGEEQQCRADSVPPVTHISGHLNVTADNILALKLAIRRYGPTVVIIDATQTSLIEHKTGFYHDGRCKKNSHNHAVLAVGWTVHRGETFFILKNSWSTAWGEMGYVKMRATTNTCGVLRKPSLPLLQQSDVRRVPGTALAAAAPSYT